MKKLIIPVLVATAVAMLSGCAREPNKYEISEAPDSSLNACSGISGDARLGQKYHQSILIECTPKTKQMLSNEAMRRSNEEAAKAKKAEAKRNENRRQQNIVKDWGKRQCAKSNRFGTTIAEAAEITARSYIQKGVEYNATYRGLLAGAFIDHAPVKLIEGIEENNAVWGMVEACASPETVKVLNTK